MAKQSPDLAGDCFSGQERRFAMTRFLLDEVRSALLRNSHVTASRSLAKQSPDLAGDCFSGQERRFAMTRFLLDEVRSALWRYSK